MNKGDKFAYDFLVSEETYTGFIELFKDKNPLHTNHDFAVGKGFNGRVMHGNILNGFLSFFIGELLPIKNVIIQTQSIKFFKPVYLGDKVTLNAEITDVFESVKTVEFKFYFVNSNLEKVAKGTISIGII
jgi:3-hydroxybutyryl-CoA dehydratase